MGRTSRSLYRYFRNFEYILDTVINRRIYFPTPDELNDPFDCSPKFSLRHCKHDPDEDWASYMFYLAKVSKNGITRSDEEARKHAEAAVYEKKLHKDDTWLRAADVSNATAVKEYKKTIRVCSFSKSPRNHMMWAHYADNHTGIVLQFRLPNKDGNVLGKYSGFDVDYYEQHIILRKYVEAIKGTSDGDDGAFGRLIWCSKSYEWEHEDEVRLLATVKNTYLSYPEEVLTGILIGSKCPSRRIDLLLKSISSWKNKPRIYQESLERSSTLKIYFHLLATS